MPTCDNRQKEAITCGDGPVMVIAGPGSGKTFTVSHRIRYLIEEQHIEPSHILVITFSKAAASEMQQRFHKLVDDQFYPVTFGTFHSVFFQIIRRYYSYDVSSILTVTQKRDYLKQVITKNKLIEQTDNEMLDYLLSVIALHKNNVEQTEALKELRISTEIFQNIYNQYQILLKTEHKLDFEDMMLLCYEILTKQKETLSFYQDLFRYILIDEFQDINRIQYQIMKLLSKPQNNLYVVGDDDQSIYRFRGANPAIMKSFQVDYPNCRKIILDHNYRSTEEIVSFAGCIISENKNRFQKKIKAVRSIKDSVLVQDFATKEEEYHYLLAMIKKEHNNHSDKECAVLFRTNMEAGSFAEKLLEQDIPFSMKEKMILSFQTNIFMDFYHYFCLIESNDELPISDFLPVMNKPVRYIKRSAINGHSITFERLKREYEHQPYMAATIEKMEYDLKKMKRMDLFARVNYIRKAMGYDNYLEKTNRNHQIMESVNEIQKKMHQFSNLDELKHYINEMEQKLKSSKQDGIELMTFHASKGLEYKKVFIPDCNEGSIPNKKSIGEEEIEEERRMFYVALTRAKDCLHVYYVKGDRNTKYMPSRFLHSVIKKPLISFASVTKQKKN